MDLQISFDDRQLKKLEKDLGLIAGATELAMSSALNKAVVGMRTDAKRAVSERYFVKQGQVADTMSIKKASTSRLTAVLKSVGPDIPAIKFKVTPGRVTKPRPAIGVRIQYKKAETAKAEPHSFIAMVGVGGHVGVFVRKGRKRLPVEEVRGPAIPTMIEEVGKVEIEAKGAARLAKELDNQVARIFAGKVGRGRR